MFTNQKNVSINGSISYKIIFSKQMRNQEISKYARCEMSITYESYSLPG